MSDRKYDGIEDDEDRGPLSDFDFDSEEESAVPTPGLGIRDENGQDATPLVASRGGTLNIDTSDAALAERGRRPSDASKKVVAWKDLPKKKQLTVITLARLSEPLVQTSLQSYMFYQLRWFDPSLPDSTISSQAGLLHASFTAAQFFTAMMWGRVADSTWAGRKTVILIGLLGTLISCVGYGFSTTFYQALFFRCLGGATNGNVGVMRTMISEIVREKKYQSRAFLILPMTFNIGVIVGPVLGGVLSDPAGSFPDTFGNIGFFLKFPYATPNLVSAGFLSIALMLCWLFLEETHDALQDRRDIGIILGNKLTSLFKRRKTTIAYTRLHSRDSSISASLEMSPVTPRDSIEDAPTSKKLTTRRRYKTRLPFRRIFTSNVTLTFVAHFFLAFHVGTFNSLWFVFLSTPVFNPKDPHPPGFVPQLPFRFTGGLGLPPSSVGMAMAILGVIGITMQLFLYPRMSSRLGTVLSWRMCLFLFPVAYVFIPFLSIVPSTTEPPSQKTGPWIWMAIAGVLFIQVTGRTFALPAQTILVNNCTPHPSVLGTVHGLGQSASSLARTVGPILGGWLYGQCLSHGIVGGVFWGLAGIAVCGFIASFFVREGNGHEIWLEGDEDDEDGNK
ncbi:MFS general substrate transporter [Hypoxylon trugodes]|uniref:MFS general substrate transporter n=1 Tax=Hypoxylon trugodes TaxID=326681 RepID=UPI002199CB01|nr:MFS general substrate transporter [Hypoxylon trugodes]KAI1389405.1 MFS general substrate transporter [Hypoxylon trugodes]